MSNPQFITNKKGKRLSVVLSIKDYEQMLADLEELQDIRLYDEAKKSKDSSVPADKAFKLVETRRKKMK